MKDFLRNIFKGDRVIWIIYLLFCTISIIGVFSATSTLAYRTGNYWSPIQNHINYILLGFITTLVLHGRAYINFKALGYFLYAVSFCFLIYVLFCGEEINGASRYASIMGIQFQPSELMKYGLIIVIANLLCKQKDGHPSTVTFKKVIIVAIVAILPIFPEDLSTAFIMSVTVLAMMIIGQVKWKNLAVLILGGLGIIATVILIVHYTPKEYKENISILHRVSTWENRITDFTKDDKDIPPEKFDINNRGQEAHANIAIATSSFWGKGPGNSIQRDFLSQAYSDFIFAIIIEEYGLIGAFFVIFLYYLLLMRIYNIANGCKKTFPAFMVMGIGIIIAIQAMFNMMVAVGILPITGQPLPFISRGGTSFIINSIFIATVLSVSRYVEKEKMKTIQSTEIQPITTAEEIEEINYSLTEPEATNQDNIFE